MTKILIIGERKAGKTRLVNALMGNRFKVNNDQSNNINEESLRVEGLSDQILLYEIPNPKNIEDKNYTVGTDAILLVVDRTDVNAFDNLYNLLAKPKLRALKKPIILVTTHERQKAEVFSDDVLKSFMDNYSTRIVTDIRTDAGTGLGIAELLEALPTLILDPKKLRKDKPKDEKKAEADSVSNDDRIEFIGEYRNNELVNARKQKLPKEYEESIESFCTAAKTILQDASKTREQKDQALENAMFDNLNKHRDSKFLKYISNFFTRIALTLGICKKSEEAYKAKYGTFFRTEAPTDRYVNATRKFGVSPRKFGSSSTA